MCSNLILFLIQFLYISNTPLGTGYKANLCVDYRCPPRSLCTLDLENKNGSRNICECICTNSEACHPDNLHSSYCECDVETYGTACSTVNLEISRDCSKTNFESFCDKSCRKTLAENYLCSTSTNPWAACKNQSYCAKVYSNGICNPECFNKDCLYDGEDCRSVDKCLSCDKFDDEFHGPECENLCNQIKKFYKDKCLSYHDCNKKINYDSLLYLEIQTTNGLFQSTKMSWLYQLSKQFALMFQIALDSKGKEMIYTKPAKQVNKISITVVFGISRKNCINSDCIWDPKLMANTLIASSLLKRHSLPFKIIKAEALYLHKLDINQSIQLIALVIASFGATALLASVLYCYKTQKSESKIISEKDHGNEDLHYAKFGIFKFGNLKRKTYASEYDSNKKSKLSGNDGLLFKNESDANFYDKKSLMSGKSLSGSSNKSIDFSIVDSYVVTLVDENKNQKSILCQMNTHLLFEMGVQKLVYNDLMKKNFETENKKMTACLTGVKLNTILHDAIKNNLFLKFDELRKIQFTFIELKNKESFTPLILSTIYSRYNWAKYLCENGASIDGTDEKGKTALHWAAATNDVKVISLLLQHKANTNFQNHLGETPLMIACQEGSLNAVIELVQNDANIFLMDHMNRTCVEIAIKYDRRAVLMILRDFIKRKNLECSTDNAIKCLNAIYNYLAKNENFIKLINMKLQKISSQHSKNMLHANDNVTTTTTSNKQCHNYMLNDAQYISNPMGGATAANSNYNFSKNSKMIPNSHINCNLNNFSMDKELKFVNSDMPRGSMVLNDHNLFYEIKLNTDINSNLNNFVSNENNCIPSKINSGLHEMLGNSPTSFLNDSSNHAFNNPSFTQFPNNIYYPSYPEYKSQNTQTITSINNPYSFVAVGGSNIATDSYINSAYVNMANNNITGQVPYNYSSHFSNHNTPRYVNNDFSMHRMVHTASAESLNLPIAGTYANFVTFKQFENQNENNFC